MKCHLQSMQTVKSEIKYFSLAVSNSVKMVSKISVCFAFLFLGLTTAQDIEVDCKYCAFVDMRSFVPEGGTLPPLPPLPPLATGLLGTQIHKVFFL